MNRTDLLVVVQGACTLCGGFCLDTKIETPSVLCHRGIPECPVKLAGDLALRYKTTPEEISQYTSEALLSGRLEAIAKAEAPKKSSKSKVEEKF